MLYLIDSSAKNSHGHNLEYLERISENTKSQILILGNRELESDEKSTYRSTFEFGTWDFGRFGFKKSKLKQQGAKSSKTLRSSRASLITEKLIEVTAEYIARRLGKLALFTVKFTKQSRCFRRDLASGLFDLNPASTILLSTANARELVGLSNWINRSPIQECSISVILRRPLLDLRTYLEIPFLFIDALIYISVIQELRNKVHFFADTPGLAALLSKVTAQSIKHVPSLGFEVQINKEKVPLQVAIAPNSRPETRFSIQAFTPIPELSASLEANLDSKSYRDLLLTTKSIVLPYDPLRYRTRSSGIFAEALTLGILPIVPTGTSMSREITKLNSKVLPPPEFKLELRIVTKIDLGEFGQNDFLITLTADFYGSIVLEISQGDNDIRRSTHDFFEGDTIDSFVIRTTKQTLLSFKVDQILAQRDQTLNVAVNKIGPLLYGIPYLEGDLPGALSHLKMITFCSVPQTAIEEHSPKSIYNRLEI
jgi:hypothetical protein